MECALAVGDGVGVGTVTGTLVADGGRPDFPGGGGVPEKSRVLADCVSLAVSVRRDFLGCLAAPSAVRMRAVGARTPPLAPPPAATRAATAAVVGPVRVRSADNAGRQQLR